MTGVMIRRVLLRCLAAFILLNVLLLHVPISTTSMAVIALIASASLVFDHRNMLPLSISLAMITLVLEVIVRAGGSSGALSPYFRPHEMLALPTSTYSPNRRVEMDVPHGDLLTIDQSLPRALAQKRRERFNTDSFGYRNEANYSGEKLILVGDSFLVGAETYLVSLLRQHHQVAAYNVSFSSIGPLIYTEKVLWSRQHLGKDACIVLFFFEGNDFQRIDATELATRRRIPGGVQEMVRRYVRAVKGASEWSKVFYGLTTRAQETWRQRNWERDSAKMGPPGVMQATEKTFIKNVGGKPVVFLRPYVNITRQRSVDDAGFLRAQVREGKPDVMVFIPEKYRVYGPLTDESPESDLPTAQLDYLRSIGTELNVPVIDLTDMLVERSGQLAQRGEFTWWLDDTHWNGNGEAVAAEVLAKELRHVGGDRCRQAVGQ